MGWPDEPFRWFPCGYNKGDKKGVNNDDKH